MEYEIEKCFIWQVLLTVSILDEPPVNGRPRLHPRTLTVSRSGRVS